MTVAVLTLSAHAALASGTAQANALIDVGRYHLQSNPWVNLHQRLLYEASFKTDPPAGLKRSALSKWTSVVDSYRNFLGKRNPIVDHELIAMNLALSGTAGADLPPGIPQPAASALKTAMPLYRTAQWEKDDRINRFWMSLARPLLESAAEELIAANEKVYGLPFPKRITVDVCSFAWEFGAYTVGTPEAAHVVISSTDPGSQGFRALESLLHEPSHILVAPASGAIGSDLVKTAAELNLKMPRGLWHAILFYTAGELTRRALAERGVTDYAPTITLMYKGVYPGFQKPLETHWQAFLDGSVSRDAAIREIVKETAH
ncbi:MAG: hypothetical protein ABI718_04635 [Acidobacteriota bacterium]